MDGISETYKYSSHLLCYSSLHSFFHIVFVTSMTDDSYGFYLILYSSPVTVSLPFPLPVSSHYRYRSVTVLSLPAIITLGFNLYFRDVTNLIITYMHEKCIQSVLRGYTSKGFRWANEARCYFCFIINVGFFFF